MFLSDISYLRKLPSQKPPPPLDTSSGKLASSEDQYDLELERLYASSPLITEYQPSYTLGEIYNAESEDEIKRITDKERFTPISLFKKSEDDGPLRFSPIEVRPINSITTTDASSFQPSGLTKLIEQNEKSFHAPSNRGKLKLTIYLPDYSEIEVFATPDTSIAELIRIILNQHEDEDIHPPLDYRNPHYYELRMHEGDGEPDRDFPAYNKDQLLRNLDTDEFCLCTVENAPRTYSVSDSIFSPPPYQITTSDKSILSSASSYRVRDRDRSNSSASGLVYSDDMPSRPAPILENAVTIRFPDGRSLSLEHEEDATLADLIPMIAKHYRIRIFTDEYEFVISPQDQKMLMLAYPVMDINSKIYQIGTRCFDIQKKVYADTSKRYRPSTNRSSRKENPLGNLFGAAADMKSKTDDDSNITFTEATANAYQQWNVVKKNKFGIKQERIFGVDGKKVYNAKRGQLRGGSSGVQRAERDIATIVKIEKLHDNKTFRITWLDNGDIYYIEYTCETTRECSEIVAKIRYLLNRQNTPTTRK